jgi:hypothetical protein
MIQKLLIFIIFLLEIGQLIKNNIITSIPKIIFQEFTSLFLITSGLYFFIEYLLNKYNTNFNNINPPHKKMYVVKNFIKSFYLAGLCSQIYKLFYILNGVIDLTLMKRCAIYYIINDLIGLLLVKKLPTTTKIHHITTSLCGLLVVMKESKTLDILSLIVLYAVFSSMAFCVNFYLGLRVYSTNIKLKKTLSITSFCIYLISCIVSWIFQLILSISVIPTVPIWHTLTYFIFLYSVGRDDIILMKWLYNDNQNYKKMLEDNKN